MITKAKQRTQNTGAPISGTTLRERAEAAFRKKAARSRKGIEPLSLATTLPLLHELQVHQIELEMQNEELRREQDELARAHSRLFYLYEQAPVAYCTLSESGLILQANVTAATLFGTNLASLVKQPLSRFILKDDQEIYYAQCKRLAKLSITHILSAKHEAELNVGQP